MHNALTTIILLLFIATPAAAQSDAPTIEQVEAQIKQFEQAAAEKARLDEEARQAQIKRDAAAVTEREQAALGFSLMLGAYDDKAKADAIIWHLKAKGFAAFSERVILPSGSSILRVRIGPILKRADAFKIKADIKAKLGFDAIVVLL